MATVIALVVSYPVAYWIAFRGGRWKNLLLLFIVAPFFVTYLIRTLAWQTILADHGFVVNTLQNLHVLGSGGRLLATGLANRHRPREILMERLEDTGRHVVHELERFINTLGTIAGVSPLLGLLGTVTGIIRSFNVIEAGGMGDPRALSGGIAEALICTVAGLCVAIPALIFYRYLRGRVEGIVVEMEKQAIRMADALEAAQARGRERPAPAAVPFEALRSEAVR